MRGDSRPSRHSVPAPARWRGHDALRLLRGEHAPVLRGSRTGRCRRAGVVVRARCGPNDGGAFSLSRWKNGCDELPALCSRFASWRISARVVGERGGDEGAQSLRAHPSGLFRHTTRTRGKSASIRSTHPLVAASVVDNADFHARGPVIIFENRPQAALEQVVFTDRSDRDRQVGGCSQRPSIEDPKDSAWSCHPVR